MAQISGAVTSIAQSQVAQARQAADAEAARQAPTREARRAQRRREETHEFVQDMAEATGLKVDPEAGHDSGHKRNKRHAQPQSDDSPPAPAPPTDADARAHAAALLSTPETADHSVPPPCIIDIEA